MINILYDSLNIPWDKFYIWEPLNLKDPCYIPTEYNVLADSTAKADTNLITGRRDSLIHLKAVIEDLQVILNHKAELKDTTIMVIIDTLNEVTSSYPRFPFKYFNYPFQGDSIKAAVKSLLKLPR